MTDSTSSLEEGLISRAHSDGLDILRRPDASPSAVLGVVVAKAQAQVGVTLRTQGRALPRRVMSGGEARSSR